VFLETREVLAAAVGGMGILPMIRRAGRPCHVRPRAYPEFFDKPFRDHEEIVMHYLPEPAVRTNDGFFSRPENGNTADVSVSGSASRVA